MYSSDVGIVHTKPAVLAALVGILRKAWRQPGVLQWSLVMQLGSGTLKCCLWLIPSTPSVEMLMWMVWFHLFFFSFLPPLLSFPCSQSCFLAAFGLNMFLLRAVLTILLSIVVSRAFLTLCFFLFKPCIYLSLQHCLFIQFSKKPKSWEPDSFILSLERPLGWVQPQSSPWSVFLLRLLCSEMLAQAGLGVLLLVLCVQWVLQSLHLGASALVWCIRTKDKSVM